MAEPTKKTENIEQDIKNIFGHDRRTHIRRDVCIPPPIGCGQPATTFRNERSKREFTISGLCQECQDSFFGKD